MAMKRLWVGSVALAAFSTAALAVEIAPVFEALPPAEVTPHNWTGLYGRMNSLTPYDSLMYGAPIGGTSTPDGFIGSAHFGYNYQMGSLVFGIEGDVTRRRGSDFTSLLGASGLDSINLQSDHGWIGTLRPRAGLAADNWLFYGTGGLAYGSAATHTGWTVGGGLEYAGGKQWSLGLEYLYADFGKSAQNQASPLPDGTAFSSPGKPEDRSQIVRGRLNYRFGWDGFSK